MSSTNRGSQRSDADNYETPPWAVHRLLERLKLPAGNWLEPGGGGGNIIRATNELRKDVTWWTVEERKECYEPLVQAVGSPERVLIADFANKALPVPLPTGKAKFDVAFGNPPFRLAMEFIERSLELANIVVMLLRLNFIGTEERHPFMKKFLPDQYVLPNRPSFRGEGCDSIEYSWMVWPKGRSARRFGKLTLLDLTPLGTRQAQKPPSLGPVAKKSKKAV
jgi:hypothetical protein